MLVFWNLATAERQQFVVTVVPPLPVLVLWNLTTGDRRQFAIASAETIQEWRFSPDGQTLAVIFSNGLVEFWSTATAQRQSRCNLDGATGLQRFRLSPDLRRVVALRNPAAGARLWSLSATGESFEGQTILANRRFESAWFTESGRAYALSQSLSPTRWLEQLLLGLSAQRTELVIRDLDDGGKEVLRLPGCVCGIPSPDGRLVAVKKQQAGGVELWEVSPRLSAGSAFTLAVLAGILAGVCVWCLAGWRRPRLSSPSLACKPPP
jgi:WD40 repeat protein